MTHGLGEVTNRSGQPPSVIYPRKINNSLALTVSRLISIGKCVCPCIVKSFRKVVSTVTDDMGTDVGIIDNINMIVKLGNQSVNTDASSGLIEEVILVDMFR
jgi:hypothetical protein